jgi:gliding motility-associated-like protein
MIFGKKYIIVFFYILSLLFAGNSFAQSYWMQRAGGTTIDEAYSISSDGSGNTYTTGYFSGSANFGTFNLVCNGISDMFITKTDKNGVFQWAVKAGGVNSCRGLAIKTDATGNSYVTGFYYGSATFGSKTITSTGLQDVFIAKYDNTGALVWVSTAGGSMSDIGNAITIDNSGNVLVTGEFAGTATFGSFSLTSTKNNVNVFTTKLDANGNFLWAKMGSGSHTDRGLGIGCDPTGNVYVTGQFTDTITFDNIHFSSMYNAIFLIKYDGTGKEQWFTSAGAGSMNIANGIAVDNNSNIYLTGDFTGTLNFFVSPVVTLSNTYSNRIFVAKYNSSGNLLWDVSDGSSSAVTSKAISVDGSGNAYIIGNFECRFNSYADQYGQGTFNSVGTWDIFVAEYTTAAGTWQWSRQIGGHKDNLGYGISVDGSGDIYTAGSFNQDMVITTDPNYIGYNVSPLNCNLSYCSDPSYGSFAYFSTAGSSDIFIAKPIDINRQPYDFFLRNGNICTRPIDSMSINAGKDTVTFCNSGVLSAYTNTCAQAGPTYTYKWSNGSAGQSTSVSKNGWYYVTATSTDGCLQSHDSVYVVIEPNPITPTISDNVVVNTNAQHPKPIIVCEKNVILTGGNYGTNTYAWSGGSTATSLSITVTSSGTYCFNVYNKFGCDSATCVAVTIEDSLPPIKPGLMCEKCIHDSIAFCRGSSFSMLAFDSITNLGQNPSICIPPGLPYVTNKWSVTPSSISYSNITHCPSTNSFVPSDSGWYHITDTIKRKNICDSTLNVVHDSVYVKLFPVPTLLQDTILGAHSICPGDSVLLIASKLTPNSGFHWSNGSTRDSLWVKKSGTYSISEMIVNSYGCPAISDWTVVVSAKTAPTIFVTPTNGVICPGDSLMLSCSGTGNFQWQGATGPIGGNSSTIYVKTAGSYYCILTDTSLYCAPILSNTAEITNYATPQLIATPSNAICPGDSVVIHAIGAGGGTVTWLFPLSGNDTVQVVRNPGIYSCTITSCGITANYSITLTSSNPLAKITALGSETFCAGDSVTLTGNNGMTQYIWNPGGISGQSIVIKTQATYTLTTINSDGCKAKDSSKVTVTPNNLKPPVIADTNVCYGETATLIVATSIVSWYSALTGGTPIATGPSFTTTAIYGLNTYYVSDIIGGCLSPRKPVNVDTTDCNGTYIPNVFTPNGDGSNDKFIVTIKGAKCFKAEIFNRWGVKVYEWTDPLGGWDGKIQQTNLPASDGVYYFIITYCDYLGAPGTKHGFVTLIR